MHFSELNPKKQVSVDACSTALTIWSPVDVFAAGSVTCVGLYKVSISVVW